MCWRRALPLVGAEVDTEMAQLRKARLENDLEIVRKFCDSSPLCTGMNNLLLLSKCVPEHLLYSVRGICQRII